ncbi:hypothetical protein ESA94_09335 [Lacibacter luteus]|uniref:Uncharacterized protein n=1 Tax=Lacibacter luteus TaxID=2508719 RepID=A0A4Q1CJ34_9BACT|nr:hypothetical protein ESA94_09335 [Lacibacter luteus]
MADVYTPQQRSFNMSRIKGKDMKPFFIDSPFCEHAKKFN